MLTFRPSDGARNTIKKTISKTPTRSMASSSKNSSVKKSVGMSGVMKSGQYINQNMLLKKKEMYRCIEITFDDLIFLSRTRAGGSSAMMNLKCRICKAQLNQPGLYYCQYCSYKKGICGMCGKKILDTKGYRQTNV